VLSPRLNSEFAKGVCVCVLEPDFFLRAQVWGTAATVPPPLWPGEPALCGSHHLVTPY